MRFIALCAVLLAACGGSGDGEPAESTVSPPSTESPASTELPVTAPSPVSDDECAHVRAVTITADAVGSFTFAVTVESDDTGWDKYADAWEVRSPAGLVLGERVLAHPHETEQPFTRSLSGVAIPRDITEVTVAAHDLVLGFCGTELTVAVPHDA
jgi:hypothetical protein